MAAIATRLNAAANQVVVTTLTEDLVGAPSRWDVIMCGDVCYEAPMTGHILPWLRGLAGSATVWIADPGRAYLPRRHDGAGRLRRAHLPRVGGPGGAPDGAVPLVGCGFPHRGRRRGAASRTLKVGVEALALPQGSSHRAVGVEAAAVTPPRSG